MQYPLASTKSNRVTTVKTNGIGIALTSKNKIKAWKSLSNDKVCYFLSFSAIRDVHSKFTFYTHIHYPNNSLYIYKHKYKLHCVVCSNVAKSVQY